MNGSAGALLAGVLVAAASIVAYSSHGRGAAFRQRHIVQMIALAAAGFTVGSAAGSKTVAVAPSPGNRTSAVISGASAPAALAASATTIEPAAPAAGANVPISIDAFDDAASTVLRVRNPLDLAPRAALLVAGWAFDASARTPCARVLAVVDDGPRAFAIPYGAPRPDVAATLRDAAATGVGFTGTIDAAHLAGGTHRIVVVCLDARRSIVARSTTAFVVNVR